MLNVGWIGELNAVLQIFEGLNSVAGKVDFSHVGDYFTNLNDVGLTVVVLLDFGGEEVDTFD